jgi:mannonate dehydratase
VRRRHALPRGTAAPQDYRRARHRHLPGPQLRAGEDPDQRAGALRSGRRYAQRARTCRGDDLEKHLAPLLIGRDPEAIEDTWQYLYRGPYWRGGPVQMTALAGVDLALWDIKGKRAGMPVYQLLGGRTRVGALAYTHASGNDFTEVEDAVRHSMERGFKVVRAQVAVPRTVRERTARPMKKNPQRLQARLRHQADLPKTELFEPGPYLRTIPKLFAHLRTKLGRRSGTAPRRHERLNPVEAARLAKDLEPYHLFYLEDPLRPEYKESFRLIRQHSTTPFAMGELFNTLWDCVPSSRNN